jgi:hypothetical protein
MTPDSEATRAVEVTQADRDGAADIWRVLIAKPGECIAEKQIRAGGAMDQLPLTQAFARHRIAATEALEAKLAMAAEGLRAHERHMAEAQRTCVRYLVPAVDPISIEKHEFISAMLKHFDGPEQRAVQEKARAAIAKAKGD